MKENLIAIGGLLCLCGFLAASIWTVTEIFQNKRIKNTSSTCAHPEKIISPDEIKEHIEGK